MLTKIFKSKREFKAVAAELVLRAVYEIPVLVITYMSKRREVHYFESKIRCRANIKSKITSGLLQGSFFDTTVAGFLHIEEESAKPQSGDDVNNQSCNNPRY